MTPQLLSTRLRMALNWEPYTGSFHTVLALTKESCGDQTTRFLRFSDPRPSRRSEDVICALLPSITAHRCPESLQRGILPGGNGNRMGASQPLPALPCPPSLRPLPKWHFQGLNEGILHPAGEKHRPTGCAFFRLQEAAQLTPPAPPPRCPTPPGRPSLDSRLDTGFQNLPVSGPLS